MVAEVSVVLKNDETSLTKKFLIYDGFSVCENDPVLKDCIDKSIESFDGEASDISVKIMLEIF